MTDAPCIRFNFHACFLVRLYSNEKYGIFKAFDLIVPQQLYSIEEGGQVQRISQIALFFHRKESGKL